MGAKYKLYFPIQIKRVQADEKNAAKNAPAKLAKLKSLATFPFRSIMGRNLFYMFFK